jgi:uncharacterized protein (DUF1015 family)
VVDEVVATTPELTAHTTDGAVHRIWAVRDPAALDRVASDLADRSALIADGHHRYAAYMRLRGRAGAGSNTGLAVLVDARRHPLRLGAIHRSVAGLAWESAVKALRSTFGSVDLVRPARPGEPPSGSAAPAALLERVTKARADTGSAAFAIAAGSQVAVVSAPDQAFVKACMPEGRSELWRSLDASVARHVVLDRLWDVSDADARVAYHHDAADAVAAAEDSGGVALLLPAPQHDQVLRTAAQGERMPRKSTSFGPKPRTGLLMRLLSSR